MPAQATDLDRPDPTQLGDHFRQCAFALSPLHRLRCMAEALNAFLAPRFVTTLAVLMVVVFAALPV